MKKTKILPNGITLLPDDSAFFNGIVISKKEAMKLPYKKRPLGFLISSKMYHAVFEAIGEASMCWTPIPKKNVFNTEKATKIAVDLCFKIADELKNSRKK